jgi:RsiW-degrading membrane proteinase PrsW (M82 family)
MEQRPKTWPDVVNSAIAGLVLLGFVVAVFWFIVTLKQQAAC